jgi:uncharacterized RDD family membrane protein YckC
MANSGYAGIVSRLAALGTDVAVLLLTEAAVGALVRATWEQLLRQPIPGWLAATSTAVATLLPWAYFTIGWWLSGQTVGNRLFGIAVRRHHDHAPFFVQAALRAAIGLAFAPIWLVGLLGVLWDDRRRAWHDRLFGTVVRYANHRES